MPGDGGEVGFEAGQARIVGCLSCRDLFAQRALGCAEVGEGLSIGDALKVEADVVVGVALGLLAGGEALAGEGDQTGGLTLFLVELGSGG